MLTQLEFRNGILKNMEEDKWEQAATEIVKHFKEDPTDLEVRSICGLIFSWIIDNGIEFQPMTSEEFLWRGIAGRESRNIFETLMDYGRAVQLNPKNHYALKWRADWFHKATLYTKAKADLLLAISISEQAEYYNELVKVCNSENEHETALFYSNKALELHPGYEPYLFNKAFTYDLLGLKKQAYAIYEEINITPPEFWEPIS